MTNTPTLTAQDFQAALDSWNICWETFKTTNETKQFQEFLKVHWNEIETSLERCAAMQEGMGEVNELYEHRHLLFLNVLSLNRDISWKSKLHADGTMFPGWFIAGIETAMGQITYHLPIRLWDLFSYVKTIENSPEDDVIERGVGILVLKAMIQAHEASRGEGK